MRKCAECGKIIAKDTVSMYYNSKEYHHHCGIKVWNIDSIQYNISMSPTQCFAQLLTWQRRAKPDEDF